MIQLENFKVRSSFVRDIVKKVTKFALSAKNRKFRNKQK